MVNQQKRVQQDTAYSAVVVNDHMYPCPCLYHFFILFWVKNDIGTGIHSLKLHYRQYHYPPPFHEMTCSSLSNTRIHCVRMRISADRAPAE